MPKRIRVLIARLGMDAHWRGSIMVARALRDAGMEVIYLGNQLPEEIVEAAIQEDADVVGTAVDMTWFCRYPRPERCVHDNGTEFTGDGFQELLDSYGKAQNDIQILRDQLKTILSDALSGDRS